MTSPAKENEIEGLDVIYGSVDILEGLSTDSPHEHQRSSATFKTESSDGVQGILQQNQDKSGDSEQTGQKNVMENLVPKELAQAPSIGLPRTDVVTENVPPTEPAQPSSELCRIGSSSNTLALHATTEERVTRRSARIISQHVGDCSPPRQSAKGTYYVYGKRPLYMTHKKDEYEWYYTSSDEDDA